MAIDATKWLKGAGASAAIVLASTLVVKWEGYEPTTYLDPVGIPTVCFGHTGKEVKLGQTLSDEQCLQTLSEDLRGHDAEMMKRIKVPINDYIHAAMLSFTYNVGIGSFGSSTMLVYLNQKKYKEACDQLSRWVYAKKKKLKGLVSRRADEMEMCMRGVK